LKHRQHHRAELVTPFGELTDAKRARIPDERDEWRAIDEELSRVANRDWDRVRVDPSHRRCRGIAQRAWWSNDYRSFGVAGTKDDQRRRSREQDR
jgi:hypothetical protein